MKHLRKTISLITETLITNVSGDPAATILSEPAKYVEDLVGVVPRDWTMTVMVVARRCSGDELIGQYTSSAGYAFSSTYGGSTMLFEHNVGEDSSAALSPVLVFDSTKVFVSPASDDRTEWTATIEIVWA